MKKVLTLIISLLAIFGAVIGALAIIDRIKNKNRLKGDYLECDGEEFTDFEETEE